jgi:hypothetical protein
MTKHTTQLFAAAVLLILTASVVWAAPPPPPPPHPSKISPPVDICAERSALFYERDYFFEIRPCTIKVDPKGVRKFELASTSGPGPFRNPAGVQHRLTHVVFRGFVPAARAGTAILIAQTGRTLRLRLPNRLPSVARPYIVTLPRAICREDGWLVSVAVSNGTETKPFGVINSGCASPRRSP